MTEITARLKTAIADRYVIERELGQGGMATVYLAQDVKHDRKVALKVLRPELAAVIGAERFLQEIKVTANLQHSHILPLYDSGAAEGFLYYVMPSVEGETLRAKLAREKQLGVEQAVGLTRAVAGALEHAHKQGVIHRDIKPENILLRDGDPLIADFGIALALSHAGGNRLTETGLSIGTPHYMSPEQAMGDRELDARSDVYSLGAVLYELLTGDPPYTGSTAQAIVAKVITEKAPPVSTVRDTVPPHVSAAIGKALAKLPADRFASAADFADALASPGFVTPETAMPPAARVRRGRVFSARQLGAVAVVAVIGIGGAIAGWVRRAPPAPMSRFALLLPEAQRVSVNHDGNTIAFSPDGRRFVYTGPDRVLFVRELDQLTGRPLPGTESARAPFFSPDGQWVAFEADGELRKVALGGGPPLRIATVGTDFRGGAWTEDDRIILCPNTYSGLHVVPAAGGELTPVTIIDSAGGLTSHRWPAVLPGGRAAVFTAFGSSQQEAYLAVADLETGVVRSLELRGLRPQYAASGHLVYGTNDGAVVAVPFDARRLAVMGPPVSLFQGVMVRSSVLSEIAISRAGHLAYLSGQPPELSLVAVDRSGVVETLIETLREPEGPRVSPDGRRITLSQTEAGHTDIWVHDLREGTMTRMTFDGNNRYPEWSPDGRRIGFSRAPDGSTERDLFWVAGDGSGTAEPLYRGPGVEWELSWMPDGQGLAFRHSTSGGGRDILLLAAEGTEPQPFAATEFNERSPTISPDGRWLAYTSSEAGPDEVYLRPIPGPGGKRQVSAGGGSEPVWSRDGRELFYRGRDRSVYAVEIRTQPSLSVGQRRVLFEDRFATNLQHTNWDRMADGRFVMLRGSEEPTSLVVVLNWFEELRQRVAPR